MKRQEDRKCLVPGKEMAASSKYRARAQERSACSFDNKQ
jgi:hypothetical protein